MYVIDVMPFSRTAPGVLSYRSKEELPVGSIVDITLRKTPTQGVVVSSLPVTDAKEMLKNARFLLSKSAPSPSGILPEVLLIAAKEIAEYHATTVGAVLATLFAEHIRAGVPIGELTLQKGSGFVRIGVEKSLFERVEEYRSVIEERTKHGEAVLLVVPTIAESIFWKQVFFAYKPVVLTGAVSSAKRSALLPACASYTGLIITTPSFSWVPVELLGAIIVDRVSAGTYTFPKRPYINSVRALEALATARTLPFLLGDFPLPLEYRKYVAAPLGNAQHNVECIDARRDPDDQLTLDTPWQALPAMVLSEIEKEITAGGRVTVLTSRTGYAPAVVCRDCGQAVVDERGMPLSFSMANGERVFRSSDGKTVQSANQRCKRCESWNLLPLGVGQERVVEELLTAFPMALITSVTSETLRSPRLANAASLESLKPGSITVATEAFLPWIMQGMDIKAAEDATHLPLGIIASADSLLALPFWRSRERFVRLGLLLGSLTRKTILITRHLEDVAVEAVHSPTATTFFAEEASLRKVLGYPPYGTLITLSATGGEQVLNMLEQRLHSILKDTNLTFLDRQSAHGGVLQSTAVITLKEGEWPNAELSQQLQLLPPSVRVRIDPESLW